jgi:hypothetical protein
MDEENSLFCGGREAGENKARISTEPTGRGGQGDRCSSLQLVGNRCETGGAKAVADLPLVRRLRVFVRVQEPAEMLHEVGCGDTVFELIHLRRSSIRSL